LNTTLVQRSAGRQRWRHVKDRIARYAVGIGGVGVILSVVLMLVYLFWVVAPLFFPASAESVTGHPATGDGRFLAIEEQSEIALRISADGRAEFFGTESGRTIREQTLPLPDDTEVTISARGNLAGIIALGLSDGRVLFARHRYEARYEEDRRTIVPSLEYPYGTEPFDLGAGNNSVAQLAFVDDEERITLAALTGEPRLHVARFSKQESFLSGEITLTPKTIGVDASGTRPSRVALSDNQRWLYLAGEDGSLSFFELRSDQAHLIERSVDAAAGERITVLETLLGGISLLAGTSNGAIHQFFPVRDVDNRYRLEHIRSFHEQHNPITAIAAEQRRKGFVAADASGYAGIYYTTAARTVQILKLDEEALDLITVAPRSNALMAENDTGGLIFWRTHNEHPEVSWSALWRKVWYEGYEDPEYTWQSSAATNDFEPKFSLMPLTFGTLKAAFYAMLFAVPLALMGAVYTANFMAPKMRQLVKPTIEIMAALPTVILGFIAGLWLAPYVEAYLAGIFGALLVMPLGVLGFAWLWTHALPKAVRHAVPDGWDAALLIPVVILSAVIGNALGGAAEQLFFGGDLRTWLTADLGISYDQRNSLVVGFAMGFAVIPTIFSIAEDAVFGVPQGLSHGSLALGATRWDTLVRVVIPTASPGIFSALMIGLGRAVGETMIVLMATGNTPIMDFSIFEGMRTLSANIAVEMPESELNSTHYRVLFLAALVLFLFTFVVNTGAEIIRQRLRGKYSSL
jgi:phosphate transport system permease protein